MILAVLGVVRNHGDKMAAQNECSKRALSFLDDLPRQVRIYETELAFTAASVKSSF